MVVWGVVNGSSLFFPESLRGVVNRRISSYRIISIIHHLLVDFSCVGGWWIKKSVRDQVSVEVVDLGHEGGW